MAIGFKFDGDAEAFKRACDAILKAEMERSIIGSFYRGGTNTTATETAIAAAERACGAPQKPIDFTLCTTRDAMEAALEAGKTVMLPDGSTIGVDTARDITPQAREDLK